VPTLIGAASVKPADRLTVMTPTRSLSDLLHGATPLIGVSFGDEAVDRRVQKAIDEGLDVAEIRIDQFTSFDEEHVVSTVRKFSALPTIATIRSQIEGGGWSGPDEDRLRLFQAVLPDVHAIDVELQSVPILPRLVSEARALGKVVIISNHNFRETPTPDQLDRIVRSAKDSGADLVKLSAMANSEADLRRLAAFTIEHASLGLIVIGMGHHGLASRIFFPLIGSRLTYARSELQTAPGQLPFEETFDLLRRFSPEFNQRKIAEMQFLEGT